MFTEKFTQIINIVTYSCIFCAVSFATWYVMKKNKNRDKCDVIPKKWRKVGKVKNLIIYPIKSTHPVELDCGECLQVGMKQIPKGDTFALQDRSFVIYDKKDMKNVEFLTNEKIVLIKMSSLRRNKVLLEAPNVRKIIIDVPNGDSVCNFELVHITSQWMGDTMNAIDCGDPISQWLSQYLLYGTEDLNFQSKREDNLRFRLGYFFSSDVQTRKITHGPFKSFSDVYKNMRDEDSGIYSSLSSYLLVCHQSVNDVNSRLNMEDQFSCYNLRPNIVIDSTEPPYAEDNWQWIKISDNVILRKFKPCTRCLLTTINVDNGVKNKNMEPYKTLRKYRKLHDLQGIALEGSLPVIGIYVGLYKPGIIKIDDSVYIDDETDGVAA